MLKLASYFFSCSLPSILGKLKKKKKYVSFSFLLSVPFSSSKELDKQRKNKERQNDSWGNLRTQINARVLY